MEDAEEVLRNEEMTCMEVSNESTADSREEKDEMSVETTSVMKSPSKSPSKSSKKAVQVEKSPVKSAKSSPAKSPKIPKKDESEEEEGDEDMEEEKKGLFDMPLVMEGKRKRESTSFLKVEENVFHKHRAPTLAGSGTALEDIPFIAHQLDSEKKVADLRPLYRICYGTAGTIHLLRRELKKFNGFSFAKDSAEYKKKMGLANKNNTKSELSHIRRLLGLAAAKSKEDEVQTILDFLVKPHDEGKSVPKKAAAKRKSTSKTPIQKGKKESVSKKKLTSKETVDTESDEQGNNSDSGKEDDEKTQKKTPQKRKANEQAMKTPSKKAKKAVLEEDEDEKGDDHSITSSSDSSAKEEEKSVLIPSDKELQQKIVELLKTFDLTSVSMKQMVLSVCEAFPEHPQLNERSSTIKAFIKDAIRDVE